MIHAKISKFNALSGKDALNGSEGYAFSVKDKDVLMNRAVCFLSLSLCLNGSGGVLI